MAKITEDMYESMDVCDIAYLTLEMGDVQIALDYLLAKAIEMSEDDEVTAVYKRLTYGVIRCVELDKKCAKRYIPNFITSLQDLQENEKTIEVVYQTLLELPPLLQSRWDLITLLTTSKMCPNIAEVLFKEAMACAPDQDLAARCSSTVLTMATSETAYERAAQLIFRGLTSPICAVRNNVHRSWLCRIINIKKSQKCVEKLLDLCRSTVLNDNCLMWPVAFRETPGLSCVDLEWRPTLDEEPFDTLTFSLLAYFAILIALKNSSSHVKIKLENNDKVVSRGIEYFVAIAAKQAFVVCSKYKIYPPNLEKAILFESENGRNPEIFDLVDEPMQRSFSKDGQVAFTKEKLKYRMMHMKPLTEKGAPTATTSTSSTTTMTTTTLDLRDVVRKEHVKFYPAEDEGNLKVEVNMHNELNAMRTLDRFLKIQHPTEEYPSVAAVMETLSSQNIDERLFCKKIAVLLDIVMQKYIDRKFSRKIVVEFVFKVLTKIPLRSIVDYAGEIIIIQCAEVMFREKIFRMSVELLEKDDENARPLSLMHSIIASSHLEDCKITEVWTVIKKLKAGEKKRKMSEMLAKVVQCADINVDIKDLHDMVLCSLGLQPDRFDIESTQLFVAAVSKFLDFRAETERVLLFQVIHENPTILELIDQILSYPPSAFSRSAYQMVLYFFTRFHFGALQFYPEHHLRIIHRITAFCHWCIRKFAGEPMLLSIAVDAVCGYLPWEYIRERALNKDQQVQTDDPVERLICQNLRHHRLWVLLSEHDKEDRMLTEEDFEKFPFADFIVEVLKNRKKGMQALEQLAQKLLKRIVENTGYEHIHANAMAFGLLSDEACDMIDKADARKGSDPNYKKHYPTRSFMNTLIQISGGFNKCSERDLRMANSWLGKGLGKMQLLTEQRFCLKDCPA